MKKFVLALVCLVFPFASQAVPAQGHSIMVAGPSPAAVEVARSVSLRGGNIYDVAVAVGLSLAVTHPYYAAFGGGGFALVKTTKGTRALDFRETAPAKANTETYKTTDKMASITGGLAVGTPGVAAGLFEIHKQYGKLPWKSLFPEVIALAEKGFRVNGEWASNTARNNDRFNKEALPLFFKKEGVAYKPGELFKQPALAKFLKSYRDRGPKAFYEGAVAKEIADVVQKNGGLLTAEDLKAYKVRWLDPLTTEFAGHKVYLMPPPSSGGVVIAQALKLAEKLKLSEKPMLSADEYHHLGEIMKVSYRGRSLLGDPDFAKNPIEPLLNDKYLSTLAARIKPDRVIDPEPIQDINFEKEQTTHFSVMDAAGNAVAFTVTLNGDYGSGLVAPKSGIALNNEMDDFTTKLGQPNMFGLIQGEANQVRAGARPLSSMSPTIVEKDGKTVLAIGSPGGPRIISAVFQVVYRSLTQGLDIDQVIQTPRVHHQFLPNKLFIDANRFAPEVLDSLRKRGHVLQTGSTAKVYGVRLLENGLLNGAADMRGEGAAGGI